MRWKTDEIKKLMEQVAAETSRPTMVGTGAPGGDVDTSSVQLHFTDEDWLFFQVCGFNCDNYDTARTPDDVEVEMVELTDGAGSSCGCASDDEDFGIAMAKVKARLRKMGFSVVPRLKDYF
jgi:hypothetical protein